MWACVYTSAGVCEGVFARARTYACMSIVRVHACMWHVRMYACTLCGRILACDCVHVRSVGARAHVCMCGCVCACACASMRVHARVRVCVRSRAYVCRGACVSARARPYAHVHAGSRVDARARKCKCPHQEMRLYMCVDVRGYVYVLNTQTHKTVRVVSKKQHRRQEGTTCTFYIYISLSFLSPSSTPFSFIVSSYLCII